MEQTISVLMVGRIYEEEEVFKIIEQAIRIISTRVEAHFFFTDSRTKDKVLKIFPKLECYEFKAALNH